MALVNTSQMLTYAKKERYSIANFDVFNIELLRGVLSAAEQMRSPVILAWANAFSRFCPMEEFAPAAIAAANRASVPVALHLDHAANLDLIKRAIDCGFTSVMLDASEQPFETNVQLTKEVVEYCHPQNISVEAELGHVGGLEGQRFANAPADETAYTNVQEAKEFVKQTGVDTLAVAIGTVHGTYKATPKLSLERLEELNAALDIPLALHGGSGLSDEDFRAVISRGIAKTNIFTDLTVAAVNYTIQNASDQAPYLALCLGVTEAIQQEAIKKIELFGSKDKA